MSLRHTQQPLDRCRPRHFLRKQNELHRAPGRAATPSLHHHNLTRGGEIQPVGRSLFF